MVRSYYINLLKWQSQKEPSDRNPTVDIIKDKIYNRRFCFVKICFTTSFENHFFFPSGLSSKASSWYSPDKFWNILYHLLLFSFRDILVQARRLFCHIHTQNKKSFLHIVIHLLYILSFASFFSLLSFLFYTILPKNTISLRKFSFWVSFSFF